VSEQWAQPWIRPHGPRPAGIYNCLLGGTDNNSADRAAAAAIRAIVAEAGAAAWANRGFHQRAAIWMACQSIGQFIDLGCGLSTRTSTCAAVQKINPSAQVLYVDHDPVVIVHASTQLTGATTSVLLADMRDPDALLTAVGLDGLIDLTIPTGLPTSRIECSHVQK
jgi:hypothetical protein